MSAQWWFGYACGFAMAAIVVKFGGDEGLTLTLFALLALVCGAVAVVKHIRETP